jgi:Cu2+-exporting ATPase
LVFQNRELKYVQPDCSGSCSRIYFQYCRLNFPDIIPHEIRGSHHEIPLYFEAVCVILTLVILGQLMEAAAHKKQEMPSVN